MTKERPRQLVMMKRVSKIISGLLLEACGHGCCHGRQRQEQARGHCRRRRAAEGRRLTFHDHSISSGRQRHTRAPGSNADSGRDPGRARGDERTAATPVGRGDGRRDGLNWAPALQIGGSGSCSSCATWPNQRSWLDASSQAKMAADDEGDDNETTAAEAAGLSGSIR